MPDALSALTDLGRRLVDGGHAPHPAWSEQLVGGRIDLADDGTIVDAVADMGRRVVATAPERTSNVAAGFLAGAAPYWIGGPRQRDADSLEAARRLHGDVLTDVDHPAARAVLAALADPRGAIDQVARIPVLLIPRHAGRWLHEIPAIRLAWQQRWDAAPPPMTKHPLISNIVYGAQTSRLSTDNMESAKSYGQSSPPLPPGVDLRLYGIALNALLRRPGVWRVDDTALVAWSSYDPTADITPHIVGRYDRPRDPLPTQGDIHVLVLARPPRSTRAALRYYWTIGIGSFAAAVDQWRSHFADAVGKPIDAWAVPLNKIEGGGKWLAACVQAILNRQPPPRGLLTAIVSGIRAKRLSPNDPATTGLLSR